MAATGVAASAGLRKPKGGPEAIRGWTRSGCSDLVKLLLCEEHC